MAFRTALRYTPQSYNFMKYNKLMAFQERLVIAGHDPELTCPAYPLLT
jgi:hypothetical protein